MSEATAAAPAAPTAAPAAPAAPLTAASALTDTPAGDPAAAPAEAPATDAEPPALKMPGKDASPEEWAAFYNQIGRPETPDAYELPVPEGDDGTFAKQMAPLLHKHGLSAEQAKGLATDWNAFVASQQQAAAAAETQRLQAAHAQNTAEAEALRNEWGQQHDANMHFAKQAVKQFVPGEKAGDVIAAIEGVLGYKGTIQFLHSVGKGLGEGDAVGLGANNDAPRKSAAQILYGGS